MFYILLDELIRKTTASYEILIWLNTRAPELPAYIERLAHRGIPIKLIGTSPENVGMAGYKMLFLNAKHDLIAQVHDDVVCISKKIAEKATEIFKVHKEIKQIVTDVIQDPFTTGGRPGDDAYQPFPGDDGLWTGPVDGWFSIYHKSILPILMNAPYQPYFYLGSYVQMQLRASKNDGVLSKKMKVFHTAGPAYAHLFETVEAEVRKYIHLGNKEMVEIYRNNAYDRTTIDQMSKQYLKNVESLEAFGNGINPSLTGGTSRS